MKYIGEIDGLRAVAVGAVLLYHAGFDRVSGGFVGVDVFFVISGYLITGILLAGSQDDGRFLSRFYVRRILRIVPALSVTLAGTALAYFTLLPPPMSGELLASLVSAALSYSNLWFYFTVDYFAAGATNPVLHTWSLAVEEQFYLLFPLLLFLIARTGNSKHTSIILGVLFCASLAAAGLVALESQPMAFYFPWLRAWELLAGSLLAAARYRLHALRFKALVSNLGLAMIVAACLLYHNRMVFPGFSALLPVVGAAAVIAGVGSQSMANRILRQGFMRWIGRISYSLYLVHWPIVCAASLFLNMTSIKVKIAVIVASVLLAWISWRFVETPFRAMAGRVPDRRVFLGAAAVVLGAIPYCFALQVVAAAAWERFPTALHYSGYLKSDNAFFREGTCFLTPKFPGLQYFSDEKCLARDPARKSVLVVGDSHAANIVTALAAQHPSLNVLQATSSGCKPTLDAAGPPFCTGLMKKVLLEWLPAAGPGVEYVVIAAWWAESDVEPLRRTIAHLHRLDKRVILYGPSPAYYVPVPLFLAYEQILGVDLARRLLNRSQHRMDARLRTEFAGEVTYFSPTKALCEADGCVLVEGGAPLFFDRDHFTERGARQVVEGFPLP